MTKIKGAIIVLILGCMLIPAFRPTTGLSNILRYNELRHGVEKSNSNLSTVDNSISALRKKINEYRGTTVDAEDAKSVYTAVTSISGITAKEAKVITINQDTSAVSGDFNPEADNTKIDGIQLTLHVSDITAFMTALSALNLPYEAINVVYPENKIIVKFNTKGGLV